jgi:hypothetical protein
MYCNNPIEEYVWPSQKDPVVRAQHNGAHCLFYDPAFDQSQIQYQQHLTDLCNWANRQISDCGITRFLQDPHNHYDIANLVKLNLWINDIRQQGIVKPMLISYINGQYVAANGESRLRALECIPEISSVAAFVDTAVKHADQFGHLEPVVSFDHFADICQAQNKQQFLFRFTAADAPNGIDWYEYNSSNTARVTPGQEYCVSAVANYLQQHPDTVFSPDWFDCLVDWNCYKNF